MFKFKSYNVKKVSEKNEKQEAKPSSSTGTLKKHSSLASSSKGTTSSSSKTKKKASPEEIKSLNNKQSPEYSKKIYPKKTVTEWHKNATYSAKNKTEKVVIPSPHKKLKRK